MMSGVFSKPSTPKVPPPVEVKEAPRVEDAEATNARAQDARKRARRGAASTVLAAGTRSGADVLGG